MERFSACFVEGCFTYDLAVQIVGTLGALGIALVVFWLTQRAEESTAAQTRQLQQVQIDRAVQAMEQQRNQWEAERRTRVLERERQETAGQLATGQALSTELLRIRDLNDIGRLKGFDTASLDGLTRDYALLPVDLDATLKAHRLAHLLTHPVRLNKGASTDLDLAIDRALRDLDGMNAQLTDHLTKLEEAVQADAGLEFDTWVKDDDLIWSKSPDPDALHAAEYAFRLRPPLGKRPAGPVIGRAAPGGHKGAPEE